MKHSHLILLIIAIAFFSSCKHNVSLRPNDSPAISADKQLEKRVKSTLNSLSLRDKAGQMVQITLGVILNDGTRQIDTTILDSLLTNYRVGSFLNVPFNKAASLQGTRDYISIVQQHSMDILGIPTVYGLDMIHGASYVAGATLFPQEINLAATFNTSFATAMGKIVAYESRAAMCPWIFSPVMDLGLDPRWSRQWESWGEDPYVQGQFSSAVTCAAQGEDLNCIDNRHVAVSVKHFMGYGVPRTGKDRTPAIIPEYDLKERFFRPFKLCLEDGALTLMVNSASINGIPMHANETILTGWVKKGLKWDGMIVTDWADINNLYTREHIAVDKKDALRIGINAGIDMIMEPYDASITDLIVELVEEGKVSEERIDDAVSRILRLKYRLGLFDNPVWDTSDYEKFGCDEFTAQSKAAAIESEVLLKNNGILPLAPGTKILLTGPNANSMRTLNGGWSYTWQGSDAEDLSEQYDTIFEALCKQFGNEYVKYVPGVEYDFSGDWQTDCETGIDKVVSAASWADVIIACVGENTYCETPGNMSDLTLSSNQRELVKRIAKSGKPVVLVLNEGRPRIISDIEPLASAVIDIMLPSNYGGNALAKLISGEANFSGKLPFTYPKYVHSIHNYNYKVSENVETMNGEYNYDAIMDVQWPFGAGLSYTTFEYSNLTCNEVEFDDADILEFNVTVTNTGKVAGKESVLLYSSDLVASMVPDVKRLRAFDKVELAPGESRTVTLKVPAYELAFVRTDGRWTLEEGNFRISVADQNLTVRCLKTKVWNTQNLD